MFPWEIGAWSFHFVPSPAVEGFTFDGRTGQGSYHALGDGGKDKECLVLLGALEKRPWRSENPAESGKHSR